MEENNTHKRFVVIAAVDVIAGNDDLLSEILLRLPARSLIRFSVVCKHWYFLISSKQFRLSQFCSLALSSALSPSGIYFYDCLTNLPKIEPLPLTDYVTSLPPLPYLDEITALWSAIIMDRMFMESQVKVTQSCNGVLLCEVSSETGIWDYKHGFVYNPATKEHLLLPSNIESCVVISFCLVFDPSEAPYYKVLCLKHFDTHGGDIYIDVYVPGSQSWRCCCHFSPPPGVCFDSGVFWNGGIHWIGIYSIIYFDPISEGVVRRDTQPRPPGRRYEKIRYVGEWGGHLHLIHIQSLCAKKFNVLELDKYTWRWSVKYRVHLAPLISTFPEMVQERPSGITKYRFSILSVIRGETEEDSVLLLTIPGKVVAYNLVRKTVKVVRELHGEVVDTLLLLQLKAVSAFKFTESFAPLTN